MITIRERLPHALPADAELVLPFESRQKSRLMTALASGEPVGLMLDRGTVLRGGDCLRVDDGRVVRVVAADEALMEARCSDAAGLARCAYHLGNRHTPVQVGDGWVRFAADDVLAGMARAVGATVTSITAPFEPEGGAYAGGHHHHSGDAKHAGIIHDMITRVGPRA
jgi:urease accessory protein